MSVCVLTLESFAIDIILREDVYVMLCLGDGYGEKRERIEIVGGERMDDGMFVRRDIARREARLLLRSTPNVTDRTLFRCALRALYGWTTHWGVCC